jgi:hypothetical protein
MDKIIPNLNIVPDEFDDDDIYTDDDLWDDEEYNYPTDLEEEAAENVPEGREAEKNPENEPGCNCSRKKFNFITHATWCPLND